MKTSYGRSLRLISTILIVAFLCQDLAWATPDFKATKLSFDQKFSLSYSFPKSVAHIEDSYKAPNVIASEAKQSMSEQIASSPTASRNDQRKTIFLLQDAHTNESGQLNLAKTIEILLGRESGLRYVFTEAAVGDNSVDFLRTYRPVEERQDLARRYVRKGLLHGTEYLQLTSDADFVLWGVEKPEQYIQSLEDYKKVAKERERFDLYLKKIESALDTLKQRLFNPSLLMFDAELQKYQKEELSLTDYFDVLAKEADLLDIPLSDYPNLGKLKTLKDQEAQINFKAANDEQAKAVRSLSKEDQSDLKELTESGSNSPTKLMAKNQDMEKSFYALLEEKLIQNVIPAKNAAGMTYPMLFKYFSYLDSARHIEAQKILSEIKTLEQKILSARALTDDEKTLVRCSQVSGYLYKLFHLTLVPEEFKEYQATASEFGIEHLTGFLNKKIMDLGMYYDRALFLEPGYEEMVKRSENFYALTFQRDEHFLSEMLSKMDQENQQKAALVTGGFHTANLKALLKAKGISFVSITPQVFKETNMKLYEGLLLNQKMPQAPNLGTTVAAASGLMLALFPSGSRLPVPEGSRLALEDIGNTRLPLSAQIETFRGSRLSVTKEESTRILSRLQADPKKMEFKFSKYRIFDIVISATAIILLVIPAVVMAGLIKATRTGPVFFNQERLTHNSEVFVMRKFRTLEADGKTYIKLGSISLGQILKSSRLDEIPQFIDVFMGRLAFFGPRPVSYSYVVAAFSASANDALLNEWIEHVSSKRKSGLFSLEAKNELSGKNGHDSTKLQGKTEEIAIYLNKYIEATKEENKKWSISFVINEIFIPTVKVLVSSLFRGVLEFFAAARVGMMTRLKASAMQLKKYLFTGFLSIVLLSGMSVIGLSQTATPSPSPSPTPQIEKVETVVEKGTPKEQSLESTKKVKTAPKKVNGKLVFNKDVQSHQKEMNRFFKAQIDAGTMRALTEDGKEGKRTIARKAMYEQQKKAQTAVNPADIVAAVVTGGSGAGQGGSGGGGGKPPVVVSSSTTPIQAAATNSSSDNEKERRAARDRFISRFKDLTASTKSLLIAVQNNDGQRENQLKVEIASLMQQLYFKDDMGSLDDASKRIAELYRNVFVYWKNLTQGEKIDQLNSLLGNTRNFQEDMERFISSANQTRPRIVVKPSADTSTIDLVNAYTEFSKRFIGFKQDGDISIAELGFYKARLERLLERVAKDIPEAGVVLGYLRGNNGDIVLRGETQEKLLEALERGRIAINQKLSANIPALPDQNDNISQNDESTKNTFDSPANYPVYPNPIYTTPFRNKQGPRNNPKKTILPNPDKPVVIVEDNFPLKLFTPEALTFVYQLRSGGNTANILRLFYGLTIKDINQIKRDDAVLIEKIIQDLKNKNLILPNFAIELENLNNLYQAIARNENARARFLEEYQIAIDPQAILVEPALREKLLDILRGRDPKYGRTEIQYSVPDFLAWLNRGEVKPGSAIFVSGNPSELPAGSEKASSWDKFRSDWGLTQEVGGFLMLAAIFLIVFGAAIYAGIRSTRISKKSPDFLAKNKNLVDIQARLKMLSAHLSELKDLQAESEERVTESISAIADDFYAIHEAYLQILKEAPLLNRSSFPLDEFMKKLALLMEKINQMRLVVDSVFIEQDEAVLRARSESQKAASVDVWIQRLESDGALPTKGKKGKELEEARKRLTAIRGELEALESEAKKGMNEIELLLDPENETLSVATGDIYNPRFIFRELSLVSQVAGILWLCQNVMRGLIDQKHKTYTTRPYAEYLNDPEVKVLLQLKRDLPIFWMQVILATNPANLLQDRILTEEESAFVFEQVTVILHRWYPSGISWFRAFHKILEGTIANAIADVEAGNIEGQPVLAYQFLEVIDKAVGSVINLNDDVKDDSRPAEKSLETLNIFTEKISEFSILFDEIYNVKIQALIQDARILKEGSDDLRRSFDKSNAWLNVGDRVTKIEEAIADHASRVAEWSIRRQSVLDELRNLDLAITENINLLEKEMLQRTFLDSDGSLSGASQARDYLESAGDTLRSLMFSIKALELETGLRALQEQSEEKVLEAILWASLIKAARDLMVVTEDDEKNFMRFKSSASSAASIGQRSDGGPQLDRLLYGVERERAFDETVRINQERDGIIQYRAEAMRNLADQLDKLILFLAQRATSDLKDIDLDSALSFEARDTTRRLIFDLLKKEMPGKPWRVEAFRNTVYRAIENLEPEERGTGFHTFLLEMAHWLDVKTFFVRFFEKSAIFGLPDIEPPKGVTQFEMYAAMFRNFSAAMQPLLDHVIAAQETGAVDLDILNEMEGWTNRDLVMDHVRSIYSNASSDENSRLILNYMRQNEERLLQRFSNEDQIVIHFFLKATEERIGLDQKPEFDYSSEVVQNLSRLFSQAANEVEDRIAKESQMLLSEDAKTAAENFRITFLNQKMDRIKIIKAYLTSFLNKLDELSKDLYENPDEVLFKKNLEAAMENFQENDTILGGVLFEIFGEILRKPSMGVDRVRQTYPWFDLFMDASMKYLDNANVYSELVLGPDPSNIPAEWTKEQVGKLYWDILEIVSFALGRLSQELRADPSEEDIRLAFAEYETKGPEIQSSLDDLIAFTRILLGIANGGKIKERTARIIKAWREGATRIVQVVQEAESKPEFKPINNALNGALEKVKKNIQDRLEMYQGEKLVTADQKNDFDHLERLYEAANDIQQEIPKIAAYLVKNLPFNAAAWEFEPLNEIQIKKLEKDLRELWNGYYVDRDLGSERLYVLWKVMEVAVADELPKKDTLQGWAYQLFNALEKQRYPFSLRTRLETFVSRLGLDDDFKNDLDRILEIFADVQNKIVPVLLSVVGSADFIDKEALMHQVLRDHISRDKPFFSAETDILYIIGKIRQFYLEPKNENIKNQLLNPLEFDALTVFNNELRKSIQKNAVAQKSANLINDLPGQAAAREIINEKQFSDALESVRNSPSFDTLPGGADRSSLDYDFRIEKMFFARTEEMKKAFSQLSKDLPSLAAHFNERFSAAQDRNQDASATEVFHMVIMDEFYYRNIEWSEALWKTVQKLSSKFPDNSILSEIEANTRVLALPSRVMNLSLETATDDELNLGLNYFTSLGIDLVNTVYPLYYEAKNMANEAQFERKMSDRIVDPGLLGLKKEVLLGSLGRILRSREIEGVLDVQEIRILRLLKQNLSDSLASDEKNINFSKMEVQNNEPLIGARLSGGNQAGRPSDRGEKFRIAIESYYFEEKEFFDSLPKFKTYEAFLSWFISNKETLQQRNSSGESINANYAVAILARAKKIDADKQKNFELKASAYDYAQQSDVVKSAEEIKNYKEFRAWYLVNKEGLISTEDPSRRLSAGYAAEVLVQAGKIKPNKLKEMQFIAGAFDYAQESRVIQEAPYFEDFGTYITWYESNQWALTYKNDPKRVLAPGYVVEILAEAEVPKISPKHKRTFQLYSNAFQRAQNDQNVIKDEMRRIFRTTAGQSYNSDYHRLWKEFDPLKLLTLDDKKGVVPISISYRKLVLKFAYEVYGKVLINEVTNVAKPVQIDAISPLLKPFEDMTVEEFAHKLQTDLYVADVADFGQTENSNIQVKVDQKNNNVISPAIQFSVGTNLERVLEITTGPNTTTIQVLLKLVRESDAIRGPAYLKTMSPERVGLSNFLKHLTGKDLQEFLSILSQEEKNGGLFAYLNNLNQPSGSRLPSPALEGSVASNPAEVASSLSLLRNTATPSPMLVRGEEGRNSRIRSTQGARLLSELPSTPEFRSKVAAAIGSSPNTNITPIATTAIESLEQNPNFKLFSASLADRFELKNGKEGYLTILLDDKTLAKLGYRFDPQTKLITALNPSFLNGAVAIHVEEVLRDAKGNITSGTVTTAQLFEAFNQEKTAMEVILGNLTQMNTTQGLLLAPESSLIGEDLEYLDSLAAQAYLISQKDKKTLVLLSPSLEKRALDHLKKLEERARMKPDSLTSLFVFTEENHPDYHKVNILSPKEGMTVQKIDGQSYFWVYSLERGQSPNWRLELVTTSARLLVIGNAKEPRLVTAFQSVMDPGTTADGSTLEGVLEGSEEEYKTYKSYTIHLPLIEALDISQGARFAQMMLTQLGMAA